MIWLTLLSGSALGLSQAPHCFAMCGPLAWQAHRRKEPAAQQWIYHGFRALGYLAVSFLIVGLAQLWQPLAAVLAAGAGTYLLVRALKPQKPRCPTAAHFSAARPWWPAAAKWSWPVRSALLGLGNGVLPCPAVWAAASASASFSSGGSTLFMLGFAAATSLPLWGFSWLAERPSLRKRLLHPVAMRAVMAVMAFWLLLRAAEPWLPGPVQGHVTKICRPLDR
jgi:sulfite exporter TauE/SafE